MANRNWEDPYDVAALAREDGPEGLMRLADYFATTSQPIPNTVKTALLASRGPGVFPIQGIFPSKSPVARTPVEGVPEALRPTTPFMEAEAKRRASTFQLSEPEIQESAKMFSLSPEEMRRNLAAARANTFQLTEPEIEENAKIFGISLEEMRRDVAAGRRNFNKSVSPASQEVRPLASVQESKGPRSVASPSPSPSSRSPFDPPSYTLEEVPPQIQDYPRPAVVPSYTLEEAPTPIAPVAPVKTADVAAAIPLTSSAGTTAIAPTTSGASKSPPVEVGSSGDDEMASLRTRLGLLQAFEGVGSAASGKNLRTDGGILVDRMKQIEALRAKREEQGVTDTRERANNRAQVDYLISRFPDRAEDLQKLYGMTGKPNFSQMLRVEEQVALDRAKKATEEVKPVVALRGVEVKEAGQGEKEKEGESKRREREARIAKIYKDMELAGTKLAIDERKTIEQAQQSKNSYKKLESLNTIADKKEFGGFTTLAGDLGDLERVAPGFVTRGEVPEWLTREQQLLGQNWPTSTDPRVVDFLAAYGKVANEERHRQYGSAQTDGELRAFMQQLNASPLSAGPQVLAQQVKRFGQAAGRVAKGRLTRYNNVFGAENVATVFAPEWKSLFSEGGVFAAQGSPFAAPSPAGKTPPPMAAVEFLKKNPDQSTSFDLKYGAGSAAEYLGEVANGR